MLISTLDPISMKDVTDTDSAPYVVDGEGSHALKIYFENEANKVKYMNMLLHRGIGMQSLLGDSLTESSARVAVS
ncbi:MAG: hypothetical protein QNJ69_00370 [Gammaproteobacteria bacterium]|nr:hypothetical protein [Gammaproteobacteria bacterium]